MSDSEWWKHVDHELAQLIELHMAFRNRAFVALPEVARRSMAVAYGTHLRALLEFAHSGRPSRDDWALLNDEPRDDISSRTLLGESLRTSWSAAEMERLSDADKLVGHLSAGRVTRERSEREWGSDTDYELWRDLAHALTTGHALDLPRATEAWKALTSQP